MKVELLISACGVHDFKRFLNNKNINNAIIVNQKMPEYKKYAASNNVTVYDYNEKGLSKSRNRLLEHMSGDIEVISDDDVTFNPDYENIIEKTYKKHKDADVILFNYKFGEKEYGGSKEYVYNKYSLLAAKSIQVTFRKSSVNNKKIKFNEYFGIGAKYSSGEENIFLFDCYNAGLKIIHVPICLFYHPDEATTGDKFTEKEIITKGALAECLFGKNDFIYKYYMLIFKHKLYKKDFSYNKFLQLYKEGKIEYKNIKE